MRLFRLLKIIYITLKFGLDEFILAHSKVRPLRQFLNVVLFFRSKKQSRGERLRLALEKLGPIFVKFGQMLSTRRDLIPLISPTNWPSFKTKYRHLVLPRRNKLLRLLTAKVLIKYLVNLTKHQLLAPLSLKSTLHTYQMDEQSPSKSYVLILHMSFAKISSS